jgi:7-cyano-7-deazaguanine synthase
MNLVSHIANYEPISIFAPFLRISKIDIARLGKHLQVPFEETWTCYEGGDEPCGKCGSCIERQEALDSII